MGKLLLAVVFLGLTVSFQANAGEHRKGKASKLSKVDRAEKQAKRAQKLVEKIDTSGDEKIDLSEYLANAEQRFASIDANNDGYVTSDEMKTWSKQKRSEIKAARKAKKAEGK